MMTPNKNQSKIFTRPTQEDGQKSKIPMRLVQHKKEAYWFYRFLSFFYDDYVNPFFWTEKMREESLDLVDWEDGQLRVVDVGAGTGFTTQGIIKRARAASVTLIDQSPHQLAKAKAKADLASCTFLEGDAENLPFEDNAFDRYVSSGSIEYWPDPQRGIAEALRVVKPGGVALLIGPLEPEEGWGRRIANLWMLFPKEQQYRAWFEGAGFEDIRVRYIRPQWFRRKSEYGLAIAGTKPENYSGQSYRAPQPSENQKSKSTGVLRQLQLIGRVAVGSLAGFLFIPAALFAHLRALLRGDRDVEPLNSHQIVTLLVIAAILVLLIWLIIR